MKIAAPLLAAGLLALLVVASPGSADSLFPTSLQSHYLPLATIPSSPASPYTSTVWLKSIELIPQSTSSPSCTINDGLGNHLYPTIVLTPNFSYRDTRQDTAPLQAVGGITWSCSDTSVKAQLIVMY